MSNKEREGGGGAEDQMNAAQPCFSHEGGGGGEDTESNLAHTKMGSTEALEMSYCRHSNATAFYKPYGSSTPLGGPTFIAQLLQNEEEPTQDIITQLLMYLFACMIQVSHTYQCHMLYYKHRQDTGLNVFRNFYYISMFV